ncbi:MAG TPA: hypothetical protein VN628_08465, partial [Vicinamibacterales bacterium]|nr:hypothetical protein [Vicinamibacterales bacterium]
PALVMAKPDGTIDAEIPVQPSTGFDPSNGILGVAYQAPGRLLVSLSDGTGSIWAVDFSGNAIGDAPLYAEAGIDSFEGIVQLNNGRIVASNYFTGQLRFFDRDMGRLPSEDRVYSVGIGVSGPFGLAWDGDTGRYLTLSRIGGQLASISPSLDSATTVHADQSSTSGRVLSRIAYLPDVQQVAMLSRTQVNTFINFFDASTGAAVSAARITLPNATLCAASQSLEYIPGATPADDLFAIGCANKVVLLSRATHAIVRQFAAPAGFSSVFQVAFDPPNGGRLLLSDDDNVVLVDLFGNPLPGGFNIRAGLNALVGRDMAVVTSGPDAGAIAMTDADNSEIIVFRIGN